MVIVDDDLAFDPTNLSASETVKSPDEYEPGGLRILPINRLMDGLQYQWRLEYDIVLLTKIVAPAEEIEELQ